MSETNTNPVPELTELEKAQYLINEDKKKRLELFQVELSELCKKYEVDVSAVINLTAQ